MLEMWLALSHHFEPSGHHAYALEKSAAYSHMAKKSRDLFEMAGGSWPTKGRTIFNYIRQLCRERKRLVCHISVLSPTLVAMLILIVMVFAGHLVTNTSTLELRFNPSIHTSKFESWFGVFVQTEFGLHTINHLNSLHCSGLNGLVYV